MAGNIKGITIEIGGDTTKLDKALSNFNKTAKNTQTELQKVEKLLKLDPTNTELLTRKQQLLAEAVIKTRDKLNLLKEAEKQVKQQMENGQDVEKQYVGIQREITATEVKLKDLEKQAEQSNVKLTQIADATKKVGEGAETLGKKLLPLSAAASGGLAASAKSAIDFESAFAGVRKTVDASEEDFAKLEQGIRDMSKEIPVSANEIVGLAESAGQLGIKTENILDFTRVIADLGVATNIVGQEGAADIARFANIVGMSQTDFDKFGSSIVALGNNFATTEAEILAMSMRLAGAGAQVGMSEADILGLATALSSVGIEAEAGGSAFSKVMVKMQLATEKTKNELQIFSEASGYAVSELATEYPEAFDEMTKSLRGFSDVANMTVDEFSTLFKEDAAAAIQAFLAGLNDTERNGKSAIAVLDGMGISEVRLRDSLLRGAGASDLFSEALALSNTAWEENTALTNEAEQRYNTMQSQIEMAKNSLVDLGIDLGNILMPKIQELLEKIKSVVDWFKTLSDSKKNAIVNIGLFVAALAPALIAFGKLSQGISNGIKEGMKLKTFFIDIAPKIKTAATAVGDFALNAGKSAIAFGKSAVQMAAHTAKLVAHKAATIATTAATKVMAAGQAALNAIMAMNPIALIVIAIAALIAGFILLYNKCEWFRNGVNAIWEAIKTAFFAAFDAIKIFFTETLPNAFKTVLDFITNNWQALLLLLVNPFAGAFKLIYDNCESFRNVVDNLIENIKAFFQGLWDRIVAIFSVVGQWFSDRFTEAYNNVTKVFQAIGTWFAARWTDIKNVLADVANWFNTMFQNAYNNVTKVFQAIGTWFAARWTDIKNALAPVADWFNTKFQDAYNNVKRVFDPIKQWFEERWTDIKNVFSGVADFFGDAFQKAVDKIKEVFGGIVDWFTGIRDKIVGLFNGIADSIRNAINDANDVASSAKKSSGSVKAYANGGVLTNGNGIVAEAGPEFIEMVNGRAIITPLTDSATNTPIGELGGGSRVFKQTNNFYSPIALTPYETARLNRNAAQQAVLSLQGA